MGEKRDAAGAQFRADRPAEQEAVRTTIVGGRPPGSGQSLGPIPRGIEVLVKKASIDPDFAELLLQDRLEAARSIGLRLSDAEAAMLAAVPEPQLEAIIAQTTVPQKHRRAFLGKAASVMLAALGGTVAAAAAIPAPTGIRPDPEPDVPDGPVEPHVVVILADVLDLPEEKITREATFSQHLQPKPEQRDKIRSILAGKFAITISTKTFDTFRTVGELIDYVQTAVDVQPQAVAVVAAQLRKQPKEVKHESKLVDDLGASSLQLTQLRKALSAKFRVYIARDAMKELATVGALADYLTLAVQRRQAAEKPQQPPPSPVTRGVRPDHPMSFGIKPDRPPMGAAGGIRPGREPTPTTTPYDRAEQLRRQAEEFRRRYRGDE